MVINILNDKIQGFIKYLDKSSGSHDEALNYYETLYNFQKNWDLGNSDLHSVYNNSLQNSKTRRFWQRENFSPKEAMLEFIKFDSDFVKMMFNDLFNESKDLAVRIDRFIYYCDDLLTRIKNEKDSKLNNHYHDVGFVYYYLSLRYPESYAVYDELDFKNTLIKLKAINIPEVADPERHFKTSKILSKFLDDEGELLNKILLKNVSNRNYFTKDTLLPVHYFCYYCSQKDR